MHQAAVAGKDPEVRELVCQEGHVGGAVIGRHSHQNQQAAADPGHLRPINPDPGLFDPLHHRPHAHPPCAGNCLGTNTWL